MWSIGPCVVITLLGLAILAELAFFSFSHGSLLYYKNFDSTHLNTIETDWDLVTSSADGFRHPTTIRINPRSIGLFAKIYSLAILLVNGVFLLDKYLYIIDL